MTVLHFFKFWQGLKGNGALRQALGGYLEATWRPLGSHLEFKMVWEGVWTGSQRLRTAPGLIARQDGPTWEFEAQIGVRPTFRPSVPLTVHPTIRFIRTSDLVARPPKRVEQNG